MLQAQMSARFTAAAALLGRSVGDPDYFAQQYGDEDVALLAGKIELIPADDDSVAIDILFESESDVRIRGDTSHVLFPSADEIRSRFVDRAEPVLGNRATAVDDLVENLEECGDVRRLTTLLNPNRGG